MMAGALYRYVRYALCFRGKVTPLAAGCESPACESPGESLAPGKRPAAPARPPPAVAVSGCGEAGLERLADGLVVRPPVPHGEADADARLVAAAKAGDAAAAGAALDGGARADARGMWGSSALVVAAQYGHGNVAALLLARGADAKVRNERGSDAAWNSNMQADFNVHVCDGFGAISSAVLRELDESHRFVQKSAESTSM